MWTLLRVLRHGDAAAAHPQPPDVGTSHHDAANGASAAKPDSVEAAIAAATAIATAATTTVATATVATATVATATATHASNGINGTPFANGTRSDARRRGGVRIYMCPGRAEVGVIDWEQARLQFDLRRAYRIRSAAEAERICAEETGFMLEIDRGDDTQDAGAPTPYVFVDGLRG